MINYEMSRHYEISMSLLRKYDILVEITRQLSRYNEMITSTLLDDYLVITRRQGSKINYIFCGIIRLS